MNTKEKQPLWQQMKYVFGVDLIYLKPLCASKKYLAHLGVGQAL